MAYNGVAERVGDTLEPATPRWSPTWTDTLYVDVLHPSPTLSCSTYDTVTAPPPTSARMPVETAGGLKNAAAPAQGDVGETLGGTTRRNPAEAPGAAA